MAKVKEESKAVVEYGKDRLAQNAGIGMKGVDPMDIRPPQILLAQKSSNLADLVDRNGKTAEIGDFYHTGRFEILKSFDCYFLFAAKSKYVNRRKPEEGEKDQYKALGCLADDYSLFGMTFRSSALFTLSKLFSTAMSSKRPMYSILCHIEVKMLSGEKGDWYIPVLRVAKLEDDPEKLIFLEDLSKGLDSHAPEVTDEDIDNIDEAIDGSKKGMPF
jgi:hypothetical protein